MSGMVVHIPTPLGRFPIVAVLDAILLLLLLMLLTLWWTHTFSGLKPGGAD